MKKYTEISIGELFNTQNGRPKYVKDYIDSNPGKFPVYSASLESPFGMVDSFDFDGRYLTWVMNGYGGRVQEISGKFSATRDRGVFIPINEAELPDLSYLRHVMEPALTAAAVGRRVDGRLNEYTKVYSDLAKETLIHLPIKPSGKFDFVKMKELGAKINRIELAKIKLRERYDALKNSALSLELEGESTTINISDSEFFTLSIGKRVLSSEHENGIPVYSANVLKPFGEVSKSNLNNFERPSILWGIDGVFDWNFIPAGERFATTDHCGRLQVLDENIDPEYVYWFLKSTTWKYGFDRVYRASLRNVKAEITVTIPTSKGKKGFSIDKQKAISRRLRIKENARKGALSSIEEVLKARLSL